MGVASARLVAEMESHVETVTQERRAAMLGHMENEATCNLQLGSISSS